MTPFQTAVLLALGLMWGSSFLFMKVLLDEIEPPLIVASRMLIAIIVLFGLVAVLRLPMPRKRSTYGWMLFMGSAGAVIPFLLTTWGVSQIPTGRAAILNSTMPLFVVGLSVFMVGDERFTASRVVGVIAGFFGVAVLSGADVLQFNRQALLGDAAILGASLSYSAASIVARLHLRGEHGISLSALQMLCAFVLVAPLALLTEPISHLGRLELKHWLALVTMSVGASSLAYWAYYWLINNAGLIKTSMVGYLLPAVGVILGWLVLSEDVGWNTLAGLLLIASGIAFVNGMIPGLSLQSIRRQGSPPLAQPALPGPVTNVGTKAADDSSPLG
ncbi:MAG: EamA family transporter [Dehalococcoidia bacterium]|nr:EamA family transporter [Dehalococcoidia bacterium]